MTLHIKYLMVIRCKRCTVNYADENMANAVHHNGMSGGINYMGRCACLWGTPLTGYHPRYWCILRAGYLLPALRKLSVFLTFPSSV